MFDTSVTRFPLGVSVSPETGLLSDLPIPNRSKYHEYNEDFDYFVAANYTVTKTQGGATTALANGDGGLLLITNTAANADLVSLQKVGSSYQLAAGLRTWCKIMAQVDSLLANLVLGLVNVTTTPFTGGSITDGVWLSNVGSALSVNIAYAGTVVTLAVPSTSILVAGSPLTFAFYYDGEIYQSAPTGRVVFEVTGAGVSAPWRGEIVLPAAFPAAINLTPTLALQNSTAVIRTMTVDQVYVVKERSNILTTPTF